MRLIARDSLGFFRSFDHRFILLVNHLPVEIPELRKHSLILLIGEVHSGCREEYLVFIFDMLWVEFYKGSKFFGYVGQGSFIAIRVARVGVNKCFGCLAPKRMCLDRFIHNSPGLGGQRFIRQFSKKDVFLLTVMRPISVHADEINRCINEYRICLVFRFDFSRNIKFDDLA